MAPYSVSFASVYLAVTLFNLIAHLHPSLFGFHGNDNKTRKIEAVFSKETTTVKEKVKPAQLHGIRLQMAESGHEDEHVTLLGDEGLRTGGQVLKLGYGD